MTDRRARTKLIQEGTIVRLCSFNGTSAAPAKVEESENYWRLVGSRGRIVRSPTEEHLYASFSMVRKYLIQFETNLRDIGLVSHNEVVNALWINQSDFKVEQNQ